MSKGEIIEAMIELSKWRRWARQYAEAYVKSPKPELFRQYVMSVDNCFALITKAIRASIARKSLVR